LTTSRAQHLVLNHTTHYSTCINITPLNFYLFIHRTYNNTDVAEATKEQASASAESAKNVAGEVIDTVKEKAIAAGTVIVETAKQVVEGNNLFFSFRFSFTFYIFFSSLMQI
jgi:hypothetical protein